MKNISIKDLIILHLILLSVLYSCEDSVPSPDEILQDIVISPNPFYDSIEIEINGRAEGDIYYHIYDISGRMIVSDEFNINSSKKYTKVIALTALEPGTYLLKVEYGEAEIVRKIVKQVNTGA